MLYGGNKTRLGGRGGGEGQSVVSFPSLKRSFVLVLYIIFYIIYDRYTKYIYYLVVFWVHFSDLVVRHLRQLLEHVEQVLPHVRVRPVPYR